MLSLDRSILELRDLHNRRRPELGRLLRARRYELGLSQRQAAPRVGVGQETFSGWETGKALPSDRVRPAVVAFLELSAAAAHAVLPRARPTAVVGVGPLGGLIAKRRLELAMSREHLGHRLGRTAVTVGAWEKGRRVPRPQDYPKLARALGLDVVELWSRSSRRRGGSPLGVVVGERQARLGLTHAQVAERMGVSRQSLSRWIHTKCEPSTRSLAALAAALEVDSDGLVALVEKRP